MNLNNMTKLELLNLGCKKWKNDDNVYLLPPEVLAEAKSYTVLVDIAGKEMSKKKFIKEDGGIDDDTRFGCTGYGVRSKDK